MSIKCSIRLAGLIVVDLNDGFAHKDLRMGSGSRRLMSRESANPGISFASVGEVAVLVQTLFLFAVVVDAHTSAYQGFVYKRHEKAGRREEGHFC